MRKALRRQVGQQMSVINRYVRSGQKVGVVQYQDETSVQGHSGHE
jgi:hypothetical protein